MAHNAQGLSRLATGGGLTNARIVVRVLRRQYMVQPLTDGPRDDAAMLAFLRATPPFDLLPEEVLVRLCRVTTSLHLEPGQILFDRGDRGEAMYLVRSGRLQGSRESDGAAIAEAVDIGPGRLLGEIQMVIGGRRTTTIRAVSDTDLVCFEKTAIERLAKDAPQLVLALGGMIRKRLREEQLERVLKDVFGEMDEAALKRIESELQWVELRPGEALFEQGEASDCMYLVASGRLIGVRDSGKGRQITAEIGRGESIGEMGFFTGEPRSLSIHARRTSHLVRFLKPVFDRLSHEHPHAMLYITQLLIGRLRRASGYVRESFERSNIVVLPISPGVRAAEFTDQLVEALRVHGKTLYVSSQRLDGFVGVPGFAQTPSDSPLDLALEAGLDDRESGYRYAVYECDGALTPWTRRCIERADRIVLVGDAAASPAVSPMEETLLGAAQQDLSAARRTLVLLHADASRLPTGTHQWLAPRQLEGHHHLRPDRNADFTRLARFLTGNAIGVVLGGGGARGFAHLGVIRALREANIPIDLIGGTSMGALIAVQPALGWDDDAMLEANCKAFVDKKPVSMRDYTLPVYSLINTRRLDQNLITPYGDTRIEDLWMGYFCVSSNLTRAEPMIHRQGPVWKAIRASIALPGVFQPVIEGNDFLVDGGILNNLPGDVMRQLGGGWVIAVDVSLDRDLEVGVGGLPSPWQVLLNWCNPFAKPIELPTIGNLMMRTTLLASVQKTESVKRLVDLYIQPPVSGFALMEFKSLKDIAEAGYQHSKELLANWVEQRPELARMLRPADNA
jgi:predicted acylesterase/phospholipase RssA/CRP-like cAMP-binding protein